MGILDLMEEMGSIRVWDGFYRNQTIYSDESKELLLFHMSLIFLP